MRFKGFALKCDRIQSDMYQYFRALRNFVCTEVVRNEWGFKGWENTDMLSSEDYQRWDEGLLAGTDLLLNTSLDSYSDLNAKTVQNDLALQKRIKESLHYTLYAYVNSNLMNGVTDSTSVDYVLTKNFFPAYSLSCTDAQKLSLCTH